MDCKFTDAAGKTRAGLEGETQWGCGVTHRVPSWKGVLCAPGVFHGYSDPLLAVFRDPVDGNYLSTPGALLWRMIGRGEHVTDGLKDGWEEITTIETIPIPAMSTEQRVEIVIRRSLQVYVEPNYVQWAKNWLSGADRSRGVAESAAVRAAWAASAGLAESALAESALAESALAAARSAAWAAALAESAKSAESAAWAAARSAALAELAELAESSEAAEPRRRLLQIIHQVMETQE